MTTRECAEREVEIACKKENPNWDGKSFDYEDLKEWLRNE